jgi:hypothetical protein
MICKSLAAGVWAVSATPISSRWRCSVPCLHFLDGRNDLLKHRLLLLQREVVGVVLG